MQTQKLQTLSQKNWQEKSQNIPLERVELTEVPIVKLPQSVISKIHYLCFRIDDVEWSGVLFYTVKGSVKDLNNLEITIEDVYLMDKGTAGSTSYEINADLISFMMKNEKHKDYLRGHVHSHNTMATGFSNTDMSELEDNSQFYNCYLSVIVNNEMSVSAKLAFKGKQEVKSESLMSYKDINGKNIKKKDKENTKKDVLFIADCKPIFYFNVPDEFCNRIDEVIKQSEKKKKTFNKDLAQTSLYNDYGYNHLYSNYEQATFSAKQADDYLAKLIMLDFNTNFTAEQAIRKVNADLKYDEDDFDEVNAELHIESIKDNVVGFYKGSFPDKVYNTTNINTLIDKCIEILDKYKDKYAICDDIWDVLFFFTEEIIKPI